MPLNPIRELKALVDRRAGEHQLTPNERAAFNVSLLAVSIAVLSFIASCVGMYFQFFYRSRDLVARIAFVEHEGDRLAYHIVFINRGMTSQAVTSIRGIQWASSAEKVPDEVLATLASPGVPGITTERLETIGTFSPTEGAVEPFVIQGGQIIRARIVQHLPRDYVLLERGDLTPINLGLEVVIVDEDGELHIGKYHLASIRPEGDGYIADCFGTRSIDLLGGHKIRVIELRDRADPLDLPLHTYHVAINRDGPVHDGRPSLRVAVETHRPVAD